MTRGRVDAAAYVLLVVVLPALYVLGFITVLGVQGHLDAPHIQTQLAQVWLGGVPLSLSLRHFGKPLSLTPTALHLLGLSSERQRRTSAFLVAFIAGMGYMVGTDLSIALGHLAGWDALRGVGVSENSPLAILVLIGLSQMLRAGEQPGE